MSFFVLQNHVLRIKHESASVAPMTIGDAERAFSGSPLSSKRAIKHVWTVRTPPLVPEEGVFVKALMTGEGHTWSFDDATDFQYSSKGLGATADTTANGLYYSAAPKFGAGAMRVTTGNYVQFNVNYNFEWTAMVWTGTVGNINTHAIVTDEGHKWIDGVRNDLASTPYFTMTGGNFRLGNTGSVVDQYFDDFVLIPARIPEDWAEDWGTMNAAFGPLPLMRVRDEMFFNNTYWVEGYDFSCDYIQGQVNGTWYSNLMECSFSLEEHDRIN